MEQETEASGLFEVDDAKFNGGQYVVKLNKDFKVISVTCHWADLKRGQSLLLPLTQRA